jgi:hypothetical protein
VTAFRNLGMFVYAITTSTICVEAVYACPSTASYRSVVVNDAPPEIPMEAKTFKVKIESGLFSASTGNIYGLSGVLVDRTTDYKVGTKFETRANLGSMCDTWLDVWTENPEIDENGKITGYVTGYVVQVSDDGKLTIRPLLFRRAADRAHSGNGDHWKGYPAGGEVKMRPAPADVIWKPFKVNAEQISSNLSETNRLIRENLDKMENERLEKEKAQSGEQ